MRHNDSETVYEIAQDGRALKAPRAIAEHALIISDLAQ
jgi:hypothetical protein